MEHAHFEWSFHENFQGRGLDLKRISWINDQKRHPVKLKLVFSKGTGGETESLFEDSIHFRSLLFWSGFYPAEFIRSPFDISSLTSDPRDSCHGKITQIGDVKKNVSGIFDHHLWEVFSYLINAH